jgi:hypothetical protein
MQITEHLDRSIVLMDGRKVIAVARKNSGGHGWVIRAYGKTPWVHADNHMIKHLRGTPSNLCAVKTKAEARKLIGALANRGVTTC